MGKWHTNLPPFLRRCLLDFFFLFQVQALPSWISFCRCGQRAYRMIVLACIFKNSFWNQQHFCYFKLGWKFYNSILMQFTFNFKNKKLIRRFWQTFSNSRVIITSTFAPIFVNRLHFKHNPALILDANASPYPCAALASRVILNYSWSRCCERRVVTNWNVENTLKSELIW